MTTQNKKALSILDAASYAKTAMLPDGTIRGLLYGAATDTQPAHLKIAIKPRNPGGFAIKKNVDGKDFATVYAQTVNALCEHFGIHADDPLKAKMLASMDLFMKKCGLQLTEIRYIQVASEPAHVSESAFALQPAVHDNPQHVESTPSYSRPELVRAALAVIKKAARTSGSLLDYPQKVKDFLVLHNERHADRHVERFSVLYLDSKNQFIAIEELFQGTLNQTSVYPREVVRKALQHNAASVVFTHNHPSGQTRPSAADEDITQKLKAALSLVDVRVLDHIITGGATCQSMAEMGLI